MPIGKEYFLSQYGPKEYIHTALKSTNTNIRSYAIKHHPDVSKEHLDIALSDNHETIREVAAGHKNISKEQLDAALSDSSQYVRWSAFDNPRYKEFYPK